jgi:CDP-diacylglycerol--glycerol-3-phosphate 3-phosphatidyltransferase
LPRIAFRESLTKLPNLLTYIRIAAIPGIVWLVYRSGVAKPEDESFWCSIAWFAFFLASVTDFIDGWLARRRDQSTLVGRFLDPVADKLLVMALIVQFVEMGRLEAWIAMVILARELFINGLRAIAGTEGLEIPVANLGKLKTSAQMFGIGGMILYIDLSIPFTERFIPCGEWGFWLLILSMALSVASAYVYVRNFVREILKREGSA